MPCSRLKRATRRRPASLTPPCRCRLQRATPVRAQLGLPSAGCKVECRRRPAMALSQPPHLPPCPSFFCTSGGDGVVVAAVAGGDAGVGGGFFYIFFKKSLTSVGFSTRQRNICRLCVHRVPFAECNTRQKLCRVFFRLRRMPWTHDKPGHSGSEDCWCCHCWRWW